ncbi:MAG: hypothetical protein E6J34_09570 [Chloroflexi bacterium]|nr:MAG: hypothetical protein E6J34_09570 [Chloroflexota bacterium]
MHKLMPGLIPFRPSFEDGRIDRKRLLEIFIDYLPAEPNTQKWALLHVATTVATPTIFCENRRTSAVKTWKFERGMNVSGL